MRGLCCGEGGRQLGERDGVICVCVCVCWAGGGGEGEKEEEEEVGGVI